VRATCEIDSSVAPTLVTMMDFVELPDVVLTDPKLKSSRSYRTLCGRHFLQALPSWTGLLSLDRLMPLIKAQADVLAILRG